MTAAKRQTKTSKCPNTEKGNVVEEKAGKGLKDFLRPRYCSPFFVQSFPYKLRLSMDRQTDRQTDRQLE